MKIKKIAYITIAITLMLLMTVINVLFFRTNTEETSAAIYTLKSYRNCLALYENEEILEIYNDVVLYNLPPTDREVLSKGITFNSKEEAQIALQDFDS